MINSNRKSLTVRIVLLSELNIFHTSTFLLEILMKSYVRFSDHVFLSGNAFLSFCEMGSPVPLKPVVVTVEIFPFTEQRHGRVSDESSIEMIIQSQNGYFNDF